MTEKPSIAKSRSPRFPGRHLEDAVGYARRIYEGVHTSTVDSLTAYRLMGYSGKTGPSSIALGALRQFGLIEGVGEKTRVTALALQIFEPVSERERTDALAAAARLPDVFGSIFQRFDGRIPTADEPVRAFLIREMGFSKSGADDCLGSLRATLHYVNRSAEPSEEAPSDQAGEGPTDDKRQKDTHKHDMVPADTYRLPLTKNCVAELRFEGEVSQRAITILQQHIELMKGVWAEEE